MKPARLAESRRPLVVHVIHRFGLGGTEHGILNLINGMPDGAYRHAVVALTEIDPAYSARIGRDEVELIALGKPPGHGYKVYWRMYRLFRALRPAIVHTRNLAALEAQFPAWAAGVPVRIHGEHGWDMSDPGGANGMLRWVRKAYRPFVSHYIAVSRDLARYLSTIGVAPVHVSEISNGVDVHRYRPTAEGRQLIDGCPFDGPGLWLIGTVGRMQAIKDQVTLARAFIRALHIAPDQRDRLRLIMVGDGPLRRESQDMLHQAGVGDLAWLPGTRTDIAAVLRGIDCFVLPSRAEGMSNTILEAMATGLPVVATDVGGNGELVEDGVTGALVARADPEALARSIVSYARDPEAARAAGRAGRRRIEQQFSLEAMVQRHLDLYDRLLRGAAGYPRGMIAHDKPV